MSITSVKSGATGISLALDNNFMEPIATTLVGSGGVNQVTFLDIPQNYKHLQIRYSARSNRADITDAVKMQFNSDTGNNYSWHYLRGNGSIATAGASTSSSYILSGTLVASTGGSNMFGGGVIDIVDYSNTNKNTTARILSGEDRNGAGFLYFNSGLWMNTNAITSIVLVPDVGTLWTQYTRFSLYGIKG
jgi:hypothetical protein